MPRVEFEPTIPVFERPKTVRASDRSVTETGGTEIFILVFSWLVQCSVGAALTRLCQCLLIFLTCFSERRVVSGHNSEKETFFKESIFVLSQIFANEYLCIRCM
jgi:hypothetical protein